MVRSSLSRLTYILVVFGLVTAPTYAALDLSKPLSGDSGLGCGATAACPVSNVFPLIGNILLITTIIALFLALARVAILGTIASVKGDDANRWAVLKKEGWNTLEIVGGLILIIGFTYTVYASFIKPQYLTPIKKAFPAGAFIGIPTAYAADTAHLPNPLVVESIWDLFIIIYQFAMRWILIPLVIVSWIVAGFMFIQARGNPDGIKKAKARLWYSFVWTIILMFGLAIAVSLRDTVNQIAG